MTRALVAGATGYLGYRLARAYLSSSDAELILWCRATSTEARDAKLVDQLVERDRAG